MIMIAKPKQIIQGFDQIIRGRGFRNVTNDGREWSACRNCNRSTSYGRDLGFRVVLRKQVKG